MPDTADISPLDMMIAQQLPHMGEYALPEPCEDAELELLPVHTATRLAATEPARYALAAALFFGGGLGVRMICKTLRLSPHTLGALIAAESKGLTAERWRKDQASDLRIVIMLATSALKELLLDPGAVDLAGIKGLATLLDKATPAHELLSGRPTDRRESLTGASDEAAARAYLARMPNAARIDSGTEKVEASREAEAAGSVGEGEDVEVLHD